jgi:hypothetical protein
MLNCRYVVFPSILLCYFYIGSFWFILEIFLLHILGIYASFDQFMQNFHFDSDHFFYLKTAFGFID